MPAETSPSLSPSPLEGQSNGQSNGLPNGQPRRALDTSRAAQFFGFRAHTGFKTIAGYQQRGRHGS